MKRIIYRLNVSRIICNHLLSQNHTEKHRMVSGVVIIFFGVFVSKISTTVHAIHFLLDGVGYGIHGVGLMPFIERLMSQAKETEKQNKINPIVHYQFKSRVRRKKNVKKIGNVKT